MARMNFIELPVGDRGKPHPASGRLQLHSRRSPYAQYYGQILGRVWEQPARRR